MYMASEFFFLCFLFLHFFRLISVLILLQDVTNLRWVDLSHSINLQDLSGLSGAGNLQRLNLEGAQD